MILQSQKASDDTKLTSLTITPQNELWVVGIYKPTKQALAAKLSPSGKLLEALIERYFVCKNQLQYLEKPLKF